MIADWDCFKATVIEVVYPLGKRIYNFELAEDRQAFKAVIDASFTVDWIHMNQFKNAGKGHKFVFNTETRESLCRIQCSILKAVSAHLIFTGTDR